MRLPFRIAAAGGVMALLQTRGWRLYGASALLLLIAAGGLTLAFLHLPFFSAGKATASIPALELDVSKEVGLELIASTKGEQAALQAEGEQAEFINAALPFSGAPMEAARPFLLQGASAADEQRALECLTQAVYYEAGFEPAEGKRAVAQVVLNRLRHPAFPKSVCGVVYEGSSRPVCQFSFTCDGSLRRPPARAAWASAAEVARQALKGEVASHVGHATHYHANYVAPYWAPKLAKLQQIGAHIFYRWPGSWGRRAAFSGRYTGREFVPQVQLATAGEAPVLAAAAPAPPPDPTDRRAPEDVGGRIDVSKGWKLSIPLPTETPGRLSNVVGEQAVGAVTARPVVTADASMSRVQ